MFCSPTELTQANVKGFSIMRVAGLLNLLMLDTIQIHNEILMSVVLNNWFEKVVEWSSIDKLEWHSNPILLFVTNDLDRNIEVLGLIVAYVSFSIQVMEMKEALGVHVEGSVSSEDVNDEIQQQGFVTPEKLLSNNNRNTG
ncbi:hypothetical protein V6N13_040141 [Hibiscus sabdariffa]|uniref:Uncharacterized protein n=1 Tax=Hibiscus sabdariffa TaxID=183260 RepID=A0ABR2STP4_9ROSI